MLKNDEKILIHFDTNDVNIYKLVNESITSCGFNVNNNCEFFVTICIIRWNFMQIRRKIKRK